MIGRIQGIIFCHQTQILSEKAGLSASKQRWRSSKVSNGPVEKRKMLGEVELNSALRFADGL
jgi:hypothetical protein